LRGTLEVEGPGGRMSLLVRPWHLVIYMFSKFQGKNSCIVNGFRAMCLTIFLFEAGSIVKDGRMVFISVDGDFSEDCFSSLIRLYTKE
jgi:hypothetical protein